MANKVLELSLTTNYVPNWSKWEVLREFIQNALDSHDAGYPCEIRRNPNGTVVISNKGALLTRNTLLLGATSKADGGSRGKFGEGYKLAMLVACRQSLAEGKMDPPIRIKTGSEIWRPFLRPSANFDGAATLQIEINPAVSDGNLTVYISNVDDETWKLAESRVLNLKSSMSIDTGAGALLVSPDRIGQLYARGLWVCKLDGGASFGYNLSDLQLDRDRLVPIRYSLLRKIAEALRSAISLGRLPISKFFDLFENQNSIEYAAFMEVAGIFFDEAPEGSPFGKKIWEYWCATYGEDAVPCTETFQMALVTAAGRKPVFLPRALYETVLRCIPMRFRFDFDKVRVLESQKVERVMSFDDLGEVNAKLVKGFIELTQQVLYGSWTVELVKFVTPKFAGLCQWSPSGEDSKILISWDACHSGEVLGEFNFHRFVDIYLHELGHRHRATDLTADHVNQITHDAATLLLAVSFAFAAAK